MTGAAFSPFLPLAAAGPAADAVGLFFIFLLVLVIEVLILAAVLAVAAKLVAGRPTTFGQAVKAVILGPLFQLLSFIGCMILACLIPLPWAMLLFLVLFVLSPVFAVAHAFQVGFLRALLIYFVALVLTVVVGLLLGLLGPIRERLSRRLASPAGVTAQAGGEHRAPAARGERLRVG